MGFSVCFSELSNVAYDCFGTFLGSGSSIPFFAEAIVAVILGRPGFGFDSPRS